MIYDELTSTKEDYSANNYLYQFLELYGNSRPVILNKLLTIYSNENITNSLFLRLSRLFLINDPTPIKLKDRNKTNDFSIISNNWEITCFNKLTKIIKDKATLNITYSGSLYTLPYLLRHLNYVLDSPIPEQEYKQNEIELRKFLLEKEKSQRKYKPNLTSTQTQGKIIKTLKAMKIKYIEEFKIDGFYIDFYLPELKIALEYNGPDHYYPLQTQLNEKTKYRYYQINNYDQIKVVFIHYWEWNRLDNDHVTLNYLKKLLFDNYSIVNGPLFYENFDTLKVIKTLI